MIKRHLPTFIFLIVLAAGIAVRFYRLFEWMPWEPDVGRDMVVVRRMFLDHGPYNVLVTSGDSSGFVVNSPVYYWVTYLLFLITKSPYGVSIFYVLWGICGIIFSYLLGVRMGDRILGLIYAALISTNYMIVTLSQKIWQQSILPSLTILSVLLVQVLYTGGGILWLLAFINITFLGLHFHVSYYPIFFINSIVIALVIMKRLLSRNYTVLFGAVNYLLHLLLWVRMISPNDTVNPLQHFSWASQKFSPEAYFHQLSDITMLIINSTFHNQPTIVSASIVVLAVIILLATWRSNKHHISMLVLAYLSTIFLLALYPLPYFFGRLMVFFPLVLLLISLSLRRLIIYKFLFIISGLMVVFVSSDSTIERLFSSPPGEIERTKDLTRYIYQNYRQSCSPFCPSLPNFRIYSVENIPEESDWYTGQYWYMLEEISGVKLVHIVDYGNNLEPIIEIPNIRYLICPILGRSRGDVERLCISEHTKLPVYTFLKDYEAEQLKLPHNIAPHYVVYRWVNAYEKRR